MDNAGMIVAIMGFRVRVINEKIITEKCNRMSCGVYSGDRDEAGKSATAAARGYVGGGGR